MIFDLSISFFILYTIILWYTYCTAVLLPSTHQWPGEKRGVSPMKALNPIPIFCPWSTKNQAVNSCGGAPFLVYHCPLEAQLRAGLAPGQWVTLVLPWWRAFILSWAPRHRGFNPGTWQEGWWAPFTWHPRPSTENPRPPSLSAPLLQYAPTIPHGKQALEETTLNCSLIDPQDLAWWQAAVGAPSILSENMSCPLLPPNICYHSLWVMLPWTVWVIWACNLKTVHLPTEIPLSCMEQDMLLPGDTSMVPLNPQMWHLLGHFRLLITEPPGQKRSYSPGWYDWSRHQGE